MSNIKVIGIDLAKSIFQLHGTDSKGKTMLKKRLTRVKMIELLSNTPPCLIGIEACGSSHYNTCLAIMTHSFVFINGRLI